METSISVSAELYTLIEQAAKRQGLPMQVVLEELVLDAAFGPGNHPNQQEGMDQEKTRQAIRDYINAKYSSRQNRL